MKAVGINLPPYSNYIQSFNFSSVVLPEISFEEKSAPYNGPSSHHSFTQLSLTPQSLSCTEEFDEGQ